MPSYNHEKYVGDAIQSVLDQTFGDFEIIITDDCSSDRTVGEIKKFNDSRIQLFISEVNRKGRTTLEHCFKYSSGEYIAILNSDDVFLPNKLERQVAFLDERSDIAAVFTHVQLIDEKGNYFKDKKNYNYNLFNQPNRSRHQWLNYFFFKGNCFCHPSVLIRRSCFDDLGFYNNHSCFCQLTDFDFWIKLCLKYEIYILPEELTRFRIREGNANASANQPEALIRKLFEHKQVLENYLLINDVDELTMIFPELSHQKDTISYDLVPYFIAMQALKAESNTHKLFGLETLYKLLSDSKLAKKIQDQYGFSYLDFLKLTGKHNVFNVDPLVQDRIMRLKKTKLYTTYMLIRKIREKFA